jgi:phenylalanyl-tRNA synthetase alpha chain
MLSIQNWPLELLRRAIFKGSFLYRLTRSSVIAKQQRKIAENWLYKIKHIIKSAQNNNDSIEDEAIFYSKSKNITPVHLFEYEKKVLIDLLLNNGFCMADTPELVTNQNNFDLLNISLDHLCRNDQDTFLLGDKYCLRSHTTSGDSVLIRLSKKHPKWINMGTVYRNDKGPRHLKAFTQLDLIDSSNGMTFEKARQDVMSLVNTYLLLNRATEYHGEPPKSFQWNARRSYFPFTIPSYEIDIILDGSEPVEVLGGGLLHHKVLGFVGVRNYRNISASGMGVERLVLLKYAHISLDIKMLHKYYIYFY